MESNTRHSIITPEEVSHKFNIGINNAMETLRVTTQKGIRHAVLPLYRRYSAYNIKLSRKRLNAQLSC